MRFSTHPERTFSSKGHGQTSWNVAMSWDLNQWVEWQKGSFLSDWAASSSFTWTLTRMDGYTSVSCWTVECEHKNYLVQIFLVTPICQSYSMLVSGNCVFSSLINTIDINVAILGLCWQDNMFRESCGETPWMSQSESLRVHWYKHEHFCFHVWRQ